MDEELDHLEAELKRLEPAAVSPATFARVERELGSAGVPPALFKVAGETPALPVRLSLNWLWAALVPIAAALAIMLTLSKSRPRVVPVDSHAMASATETLKPIADESVLVSA